MTATTYSSPTTAAAVTLSATSAANNAQVDGTVDNSVALDLWDAIEVLGTFSVAPIAGTTLVVYALPSNDATNYADEPTPPAAIYQVAAFPVQAITTAQRFEATSIPLPPLKFKYVIYNNGTGQTVSSLALNRRPYHLTTA